MTGQDYIFQVLSVSAIGGLIGLDRTALGQFMISQPIVAGPLIGWILGDAGTGLVIGAVLEMLWVMDMPIGTFVPADSTIAAVWATASAIIGSAGDATPAVAGFSVLLTAGLVPVTMKADALLRKRNARLAAYAAAGEGEDAVRRLVRAQWRGLFAFFLKSFVIYILFIPLGIWMVSWFVGAAKGLHTAMDMFLRLMLLVGLASAARRLTVSPLDPLILTGFVLSALLSQVFGAHSLIIAAVVIAAGWVEVRQRAR